MSVYKDKNMDTFRINLRGLVNFIWMLLHRLSYFSFHAFFINIKRSCNNYFFNGKWHNLWAKDKKYLLTWLDQDLENASKNLFCWIPSLSPFMEEKWASQNHSLFLKCVAESIEVTKFLNFLHKNVKNPIKFFYPPPKIG